MTNQDKNANTPTSNDQSFSTAVVYGGKASVEEFQTYLATDTAPMLAKQNYSLDKDKNLISLSESSGPSFEKNS